MLTHPHLMRQKGLLVPSCWASGLTRRADEKAGQEKMGRARHGNLGQEQRQGRGKSRMTDTLGGVG